MISVLVVNYFCHALTARAVRSARADDPSVQIVVVDNSDDASEAEALRGHLPAEAELIVAPSNLGFGGGCNLALEHAKGDWILLLNPDVLVLPGCLARLVDTLASDPRAGAVSPVAQWDESGTFTLPPGQMQSPFDEWLLSVAMRSPVFGRWLSRRFRKWALGCLRASRPISQQMLSGAHMLLRRRAIESAGGLFDTGFFMYYEDTDLCRRLRSAGYTLLLDPRARVVHEWRHDPGKGRYVADSRRRYLDKHFPRGRLTERWRERIERRPARQTASVQDFGVCESPPSFDLPTHQSGQWLLELSANPLFIPSAYSAGDVPPCRIPPRISGLLGAGRYWARVTTPANEELLFAWDLA